MQARISPRWLASLTSRGALGIDASWITLGPPADRSPRVRPVDTEVAASDRGGEVAAELRVARGDPLESAFQTFGHGQAGALGVRRRLPIASRRDELGRERLDLLAEVRDPTDVVRLLGVIELIANLGEALAVFAPRTRVGHRAGIA